MLELRDFIYLDRVRLHSFVSQIQGGIVSEINEKTKEIKEMSGDVNTGLPTVIAAQLDVSKSREDERQHTLQLTDPSYFDILYNHLKTQSKIVDITNSSLNTRGQIRVGQFIEMHGHAEPPIVETWISQATLLFKFLEKYYKPLSSHQIAGKSKLNVQNQEMRQIKVLFDMFIDYVEMFRRDKERQHLRLSTSIQEYRVWCGIVPRFIVIPLATILPADVKLVGRVERLLSEHETWKIVDFMEDKILANSEQQVSPRKFIEVFNSMVSTIGHKQLSEADFQLSHPDILVTPVAIYQ